jgi:predicted GIY-YIG superfamily endonuclease
MLDIDLNTLPYVYLHHWKELPPIAALYFVTETEGEVIYIGQTENLKKRFSYHDAGYFDLFVTPDQYCWISWLPAPSASHRVAVERELIKAYRPAANTYHNPDSKRAKKWSVWY